MLAQEDGLGLGVGSWGILCVLSRVLLEGGSGGRPGLVSGSWFFLCAGSWPAVGSGFDGEGEAYSATCF